MDTRKGHALDGIWSTGHPGVTVCVAAGGVPDAVTRLLSATAGDRNCEEEDKQGKTLCTAVHRVVPDLPCH